ncbi:RNA polymerase sigma-70 factor [Fodinibius salsisoli]|uniref:RNA polymerase sigma-70 factor n=1 Tax=Fodinibius salsisoli TaxID=2820877 RepID=A0ABT3PNY3_9BACT|nr:RNA polymerase sigma-70 factor [Fodinibius salsisoli]MCW9707566.1 RNA polymerase sigma-70 factor [Fodinibius salsisoli]
MAKLSDKQIRIWGKRISNSDRKALNSLFRSLYPGLINFAAKYNSNRAIIRDIVQESFVALWENRSRIDPNGSVKAYLYKTVRNKSLNYIRDHSKETVGLEDYEPLVTDSSFNIGSSDKKEQKLSDLMRKWIEELPGRQREAFRLSRFEGLDHDEIAGVMEVSPNTVNNHIVAALKFLRERYDIYKKQETKDRTL